LTAAGDRSGEAPAGREAEGDEPLRDLGVLLRDVREVKLVALRIEEEDGGPLGAEHLAALGYHEGKEVVELEVRREGTAELVE